MLLVSACLEVAAHSGFCVTGYCFHVAVTCFAALSVAGLQ